MQKMRHGGGRPRRAQKVDLHTHILPEVLPDFTSRYGYGGFVRLEKKGGRGLMTIDGKPFREITDQCWNPGRRLKDCDRDGVGLQVLSTVPVMFGYWAKPADALDYSRFLNDHLASVVSSAPARFAGLGTIPLQAPELAARELERCVKELGLRGAQIGTHAGEWNLDAAELFPVFEAAQALGACLFVHPWDMLGKERTKKYWLAWLVGMPAETSLAICSMIFGGVLERFPRLKVCFAHGGGAFPATLGRIEHGFKVRPDLCAVDNARPPRAYLGRFYVDSLVHDGEALRSLIRLLGEDRIALGSDYPFPLGEAKPGKLIDSLKLSAKTRERLLSGTALEFLGLD